MIYTFLALVLGCLVILFALCSVAYFLEGDC
jgi:hypothetical protein